jgi:colanic acid biosynthesis glycosyl transferase WcaI
MSGAPGDATPRRILLLVENFADDTAVEELALWLAGRGYAIEVIAAEGTRADDESGWWRVERRHGIQIMRCPRRRAALPRGFFHQLQLASFALASAPVLLSRARRFRPHLIAAIDPPALCLPVLRLAARRAGAESWVHVSEAAALTAALGKRFDHVSVAGIDAGARLAAASIVDRRCFALPSWIDTRRVHPLPQASAWRDSLGLAGDAVVVLYAGSLEERHGAGLLIDAARRLPRNGAVVVVLAGRGPAWSELAAATHDLPLRVLPWPRAANLNALLSLADIHVLPAGLAAHDSLFPAKVPALLASGRPILASGEVPAALGDAVRHAAADADGIAAAIVDLAAAPQERRRRGVAARQAAQDYHEKERVFRQLERSLGLRAAPTLAAAAP